MQKNRGRTCLSYQDIEGNWKRTSVSTTIHRITNGWSWNKFSEALHADIEVLKKAFASSEKVAEYMDIIATETVEVEGETDTEEPKQDELTEQENSDEDASQAEITEKTISPIVDIPTKAKDSSPNQQAITAIEEKIIQLTASIEKAEEQRAENSKQILAIFKESEQRKAELKKLLDRVIVLKEEGQKAVQLNDALEANNEALEAQISTWNDEKKEQERALEELLTVQVFLNEDGSFSNPKYQAPEDEVKSMTANLSIQEEFEELRAKDLKLLAVLVRGVENIMLNNLKYEVVYEQIPSHLHEALRKLLAKL